jgi:hypothetical protein
MKKYLLAIMLFTSFRSFAQSSTEKEVLKLSDDIFKWEVENKIDLLEKAFHQQFVVIGSDGNSQLKAQYIERLKSGSFVHDSISVETNAANVSGNTAVVFGKGRFSVTASGKKVHLHLSYMEVFTRESSKHPWQVLAMKASVLEK